MNLETLFTAHKESSISGRYLALETIEPLLLVHSKKMSLHLEGYSEEGREIHSLTWGFGSFKILMWSQMHGNESTTTKAIFDLLNFLSSETAFSNKITESCTIKILPMLNPDGAMRYTRENANSIDLNRDAQAKTQKETLVLFGVFEAFKPDLCLNMHDQRTIFSVGKTNQSAVISFLAPSADASKSITESRAIAMQLIAYMNKQLQMEIPNHIGRYDDAYNINCVGDSFQALCVPTILFEAGHYPGDYQREKTRGYVFYALVYLLEAASTKNLKLPKIKDYLTIPENKKMFFDVIIRNARFSNLSEHVDIAIQFEEAVSDQKVVFVSKIEQIGDLTHFFAHKEIDAKKRFVYINGSQSIQNNQIVVNIMIENEEISIF